MAEPQHKRMSAIEDRIRANTSAVLEDSAAKKCLPRQAAEQIAHSRVAEAMRYRKQ